MDGKGYPRGVFAGDLSVPARVLAIADVFEALTARDRPYKPGKTLSQAMRIMGEMKRHNHIDPQLFDLFVSARVYRTYGEAHLPPELLDEVDEDALLAIEPLSIELPPVERRRERGKGFLPEYE
jgi:HD-GYP domain-containing protein (c-di-GMP phosphodiesterase class II)